METWPLSDELVVRDTARRYVKAVANAVGGHVERNAVDACHDDLELAIGRWCHELRVKRIGEAPSHIQPVSMARQLLASGSATA